MKKTLSILFLLINFVVVAQIKVPDLPVVTTATSSDKLILQLASGLPGTTKTITTGNLFSAMLPTVVNGSGTTNYLPIYTGATTIGNSFLFQSGSAVALSSGKYITSGNPNKARLYFGTTGSENITLSTDGGTLAESYLYMTPTSTTISSENGGVNIYGLNSVDVTSALTTVNGSLKYVDGNQGAGKVLTSNATGVATWQAPSGGGGISGLTSPLIPYATSSTTLGNSYLGLSGTSMYLASGKYISSQNTAKTQLDFGTTGSEYFQMTTAGGSSSESWIYADASGIGQGYGTTNSLNLYSTGQVDLSATSSMNLVSPKIKLGTTNTDSTIIYSKLKFTGSTPSAGKVLTSDANGNATWQTAGGGGGSGTVTSIATSSGITGGTITTTGTLKADTSLLSTKYYAASTNWGKLGNSGIVSNTNFIGSTNNADFVTKTNNIERTRVVGSTGDLDIRSTGGTPIGYFRNGTLGNAIFFLGDSTYTPSPKPMFWASNKKETIKGGTRGAFGFFRNELGNYPALSPSNSYAAFGLSSSDTNTVSGNTLHGADFAMAAYGYNYDGSLGQVPAWFKSKTKLEFIGSDAVMYFPDGARGNGAGNCYWASYYSSTFRQNGVFKGTGEFAFGGKLPRSGTRMYVVGTGATSSTFTAEFHPSDSTLNTLMIRDDGRVGIGTSAPATTLDVTGTLNVSSTSTAVTHIGTTSLQSPILVGGTAASQNLFLKTTTNVAAAAGNSIFFTAGNNGGTTMAKLTDGIGLGIGMSPVEVLDITKNQNASSYMQLLNNSAGTAAASGLILYNGTNVGILRLTGTGYTPSGIYKTSGLTFVTDGAGGFGLGATHASGVVSFYSGGSTLRWTMDASGMLYSASGLGLGVGVTPTTTNIAYFKSDQNTTTYQRIENTNAGTAALAGLQCNNGTALSTFSTQGSGFTTSGINFQNGLTASCNGAGGVSVAATHASGNLRMYSGNSLRSTYSNVGVITWTNAWHILSAGTTGFAPLRFAIGTNETTPESGALEYDGTSFFFTNSGLTRQQLQQVQQSRVSTQFDKAANTTLGNITSLTATLVAGKTYEFEANLHVTADAVGGSKFAIGGTATATSIIYQVTMIDNTSSANTITSRQTAIGGSVGQAGTTSGFCTIKGLITVNAAGTLTAQFAQNAATGTSSILVGSTFVTRQIP